MTPIPDGLYRLDAPVANPCRRDRRRNDWKNAPEFPAGLYRVWRHGDPRGDTASWWHLGRIADPWRDSLGRGFFEIPLAFRDGQETIHADERIRLLCSRLRRDESLEAEVLWHVHDTRMVAWADLLAELCRDEIGQAVVRRAMRAVVRRSEEEAESGDPTTSVLGPAAD